MSNGIDRTVGIEIEAVADRCVEHSGFHRQSQQRPSNPPRSPHIKRGAFVCYRAEGRKGRFGDYSAEAIFNRKTIENERRSHRFAKAIYAPRSLLRVEP